MKKQREKGYPVGLVISIIVLITTILAATWFVIPKGKLGIPALCNIVVGGITLIAALNSAKPNTLIKQLLWIAALFFTLGGIAQIAVLYV